MGPNYGVWDALMEKVFLFTQYDDGSLAQYQWVDDVEIRDNFPADAAPH